MVLMVVAVIGAEWWKPTRKLANELGVLQLDKLVPFEFDDWRDVPQTIAAVVNPQQAEAIDKIYSQTLSRTYVNSKGDYIMLSIAYGEDQSDTNQVHLPDVCYPAQGFQIKISEKGLLETSYGNIKVKRMLTYMGNRIEPLTYWTTVGGLVVSGGTETKLAQLRYGFRSITPDGLIFRVSSITSDAEYAYKVQEEFVSKLLKSMTAEQRSRVAGV